MRAFSAFAFSCAFGLLSVGCSPKTGNQLTPSLQGTWLLDRVGEGINAGVTLHTTTKVDSDGRYACETVATNPNRAVRFSLEGVWQIKDGYLDDTVIKHSDTNFTVPATFRARIVRFTDHELEIYDEANSVHTVFRKSK
jgi:hypothetical protein